MEQWTVPRWHFLFLLSASVLAHFGELTQWRKHPRWTYSMDPLHWHGLKTGNSSGLSGQYMINSISWENTDFAMPDQWIIFRGTFQKANAAGPEKKRLGGFMVSCNTGTLLAHGPWLVSWQSLWVYDILANLFSWSLLAKSCKLHPLKPVIKQ